MLKNWIVVQNYNWTRRIGSNRKPIEIIFSVNISSETGLFIFSGYKPKFAWMRDVLLCVHYVFVCFHVSTSVYAHVCTCLWKTEDSLRYYSSGTYHHSFGKVSHWPGTWQLSLRDRRQAFHNSGSKDRTHVFVVWRQAFYWLNHLSRPLGRVWPVMDRTKIGFCFLLLFLKMFKGHSW